VNRRPRGFTLIAVVLALQLVSNVLMLVAAPPLEAARGPVEAGLALLAVVLKAVAVEALWRVRPWATRALGSLSAVALALLYLRMRDDTDFGLTFVALLFLGLLLAAVCVYVNERLQARFPRPAPHAPPRAP
jgi:peptidoglycan/LPS O-acetylase OafA/YrhL